MPQCILNWNHRSIVLLTKQFLLSKYIITVVKEDNTVDHTRANTKRWRRIGVSLYAKLGRYLDSDGMIKCVGLIRSNWMIINRMVKTVMRNRGGGF